MIDRIRPKLSSRLHDKFAIYIDWILASGFWGDAGSWVDTDSWID